MNQTVTTRYYRQTYYNYVSTSIYHKISVTKDFDLTKTAQLARRTYMHSNYSMERPYIEYGSEVKSQFPR